MEPTTLLFILVLVIMIVAGWFLRQSWRSQLQLLQADKQQRETALQAAQRDLQITAREKQELLARTVAAESTLAIVQQRVDALAEIETSFHQLQQAFTRQQSELLHSTEKLASQKEELSAMSAQMRFEFRNLAQGILEEKTEKFTQVNEEKMKAILAPLTTDLAAFRQKVEDTYDKESKERFTLGREVQRLIEMSQLVSQEANNLTTALKGNVKRQGNWGEMILESILSYSGLTRGREYLVQSFIRNANGDLVKDDQGNALQPDITLIYPDDRTLILDSKVSLVAWEQYVTASDAVTQQKHLKDHIHSLRQHIDGLSRKNYPRYAQALDFVLLFVPIEPAFLEAVKTDAQLWKYAYDKRIMIVSPTNLLAILRIVADLWRVEQQNRHAAEIAQKAGALYDKFVGFLENMELVGRKLQDATTSYDSAVKQLHSGRGNLVNRAEELRRMGANTSKLIPTKFQSDTDELLNTKS